MAIKNQVQLITYANSLGGDIKALNRLFSKHFADIFKGGLHILPPFPSSADRGFAPLAYFEIEPDFGTWQDIRNISEQTGVMVDLMVNHISRQSPYFQDLSNLDENLNTPIFSLRSIKFGRGETLQAKTSQKYSCENRKTLSQRSLCRDR